MIHRAPAAVAIACIGCLFAVPASAQAQVNRWGSYAGANTLSEPTEVEGLGEVVKVDAGNLSGYALEADGALWSFGHDGRGELGSGLGEPGPEEVVQVAFPPKVQIVAIGESQDAGYAIDSTGQGWAWGEAGPALCLGRDLEETTMPQKVPGMTEAVAVQGAAKHVLWLLKNGTVETCGTNANGQLGVGQNVGSSSSPLRVPGLSGVVEVSAGQKSSCARTSGGVVYDWGADYNGQIGNGEEEEAVYKPFDVPLPGPASNVSCGGDLNENGHALAVVEGSVYGWGADGAGQLGDRQRINKPAPTLAAAVGPLKLKQVAASGAYSLGLNAAGNVYGWGSNLFHGLGAGPGGRASLTPLLVDTGAVEISATAYNSLDREP